MSRSSQNTNPFYALVVLMGVVFAVTTLAYVVALVVSEPSHGDGAGTAVDNPLLRFVDQRGEALLLWEAGGLAVAAILAMGLDRWRTDKRLVGRPEREPNNPGGPTSTDN